MVKLQRIKFLKEFEKHKIGDIVFTNKKSAESTINNGYAEYVKEQPKEKKVKSNIKKKLPIPEKEIIIPNPELDDRKQIAKYLSDEQTLIKNNKLNGIFTEQDLQILNVLPENYIKWKEKYDKKEFVKQIQSQIENIASKWNENRGECIEELNNLVCKKYNKTELNNWLQDELKKIKEKDKQQPIREPQEETPSTKNIKLQYLELIKDKKWNDATELLTEYLLSINKIYTTKEDIKSECWIYKDGIYIPQGKSQIKEDLRNLLGKWYSDWIYGKVMEKVEPDTFIESNKFFDINYINEVPVLNGILNINTRELKPFTPEKTFFSKIPVNYIPELNCPMIDQFLSDVLSKQEDKIVFYELGGFILLKEYKYEKAFILVGDGRNGKDKSIELLKRVFGMDNCCSVPLSSLTPDSFVISEFFGKMLNVAGEVNNQDLKDTSMFKALTGRSIVSGQRKFLRPITFQNYAKFVFACNELPMVYDNSKGFWSRWVVLEYPYTFLPEKEMDKTKDKIKLRNPDIIESITTPEELSGLLNKFLDGLDRLKVQKDFSTTKGSEEIKNFWIRKSNSFMAFCLDNIEDEYDSWVTKKDLKKRYIKYCKLHKINPKSDFIIKKTLNEMFGTSDDRKDIGFNTFEWAWTGIKWREKTTL